MSYTRIDEHTALWHCRRHDVLLDLADAQTLAENPHLRLYVVHDRRMPTALLKMPQGTMKLGKALLQCTVSQTVRHVNGGPLDCRRHNLEVVETGRRQAWRSGYHEQFPQG